ncbi:MAG: type II secretion system protein [Eubacteriales bacterium]|nr:type II secretion system protein [Eubacteriales bacterium]
MKRNLRTNKNSGMTLLEAIIAVSIFSIAAIILLQGFVTSGRINKKSNLYLEATSMAQNIMEEIKSKDFEEVALAFNYPIDYTTNPDQVRLSFLQPQEDKIKSRELGIKEIVYEGGEYKDIRLYENTGEDENKVTASVISTDNGRTYKFNPRETGENTSKYYFKITNAENLHETFDALIEFDGSKDSGYKKKTSSNKEEGKNDYLAPNIAKLDTKTNAFLIMERNWDAGAMKRLVELQLERAKNKWDESFTVWKDAIMKEETHFDEMGNPIIRPTSEEIAEYKEQHPEPQKLDVDEVYQHTRRTLYVHLSETGGIITAEAKYTLNANEYTKEGGSEFEKMSICPCQGEGNDSDKLPEGEICSCTYSSDYIPFYSSNADADLQNIYIFYYPNYNSQNSIKPLDEIIFENYVNYPVNLYVTKQRDESGEKPVPDSIQEMAYRMALTIREDPVNNKNENWNTNPGIYRAQTKLRTNLDYDISDFEKINERPQISQMTLTYQEADRDGSIGRKVKGVSAKNVVSYNGLDDKKATDRIYTAKVSIYKQGAAEKGFPSSELVVTLDGAKEN